MTELNPKQELFCQLYATDKEFFGNGVESYLEAYDDSIDRDKKNWYNTACSAASRLLTNVKVLARIDELLEEGSLNSQHVDKQLGFWITQKAYPQASVSAIKEYNSLRSRITSKVDITTGGEPLNTNPELAQDYANFMKGKK